MELVALLILLFVLDLGACFLYDAINPNRGKLNEKTEVRNRKKKVA